MNNYIVTWTGTRVDLLDPTPDMIDIEDIAHALSNICRFTGHTRVFYSVAQHCVRSAYLVGPGHKLEALLHDATEAYLSDISEPLKALLPDYQAIEQKFDSTIRQKFGLPQVMNTAVKFADKVMLIEEAKWLTKLKEEDLPLDMKTAHFDELIPLTALGAYDKFMETYKLCT